MVSVVGGVFIALAVLLVVGAGGWVVFTQLRARRLGLPPPPLSSYIPFAKKDQTYGPPRPARGGVVGWFNDRLRSFKNRNNRTAAGAYEQSHLGAGGPPGGARAQRGFGPLDPDEAWDARVGNEADTYGPGGYYEEEELQSHPYHGGGTYNMNLAATPGLPPPGFGDEERGRPLNRSPAPGSLEPPAPKGRNPFDDDDAEPSNISLRGVSPRPIDTSVGAAPHAKDSADSEESPTERRSIFRENM